MVHTYNHNTLRKKLEDQEFKVNPHYIPSSRTAQFNLSLHQCFLPKVSFRVSSLTGSV